MSYQPYRTLELLTGATIERVERVGPWLQLTTNRGEVHVAGGRVRVDLECPRCREHRLVEIVETAGKEQGFCSVCSHVWPLVQKPLRVGSTGE